MLILQAITDESGAVVPDGEWPKSHFGCVIQDGAYHFAENEQDAAVLAAMGQDES
jgi:hypothetical protein